MEKSIWLDKYPIKGFPTLTKDIETDVLIIGGGLTGIITAYLLREEGYKITLVEANKLMHGTTGYTTAKLTFQHGLIYKSLIKKHGIEKAKMYLKSHIKALELIKTNINNYNINCDYEEVNSYIYTKKDKYINNIEQEYTAAKQLGINCFITDKLNLPFNIKCALGFKNQAHFNITKYLQYFIEELSKSDDCFIFENSKIIKTMEDNNICHSYLENGVKIRSKYVVIASHYPCNDKLNFYFTKLKPSMTYLIAAKYHIEFENANYINVEKPIRSLRTYTLNDEKLILIGGENHQSGHTILKPIHYQKLIDFGKKYFKIENPLYKWSAQDYYTFDNIPYIGKLNDKSSRIIIATGYNKWGMLTSHVAALLAVDIITNKKSAYEKLYTPNRLKDKLNCKYFTYNIKSIGELINGRLKRYPKEFEVQKGMGKIVSYKGKKYGVYKDDDEKIYVVDAVCPHLKCILTFNNEHKTYDCPCHGSRFTYKGKYIDGPSIKDLKRINFKDLN